MRCTLTRRTGRSSPARAERLLALGCPTWQHFATLIIGRSPLRISLGGGGTDLPSYYRRHGGFVVAAAITKYVYVSMHETRAAGDAARYSQIERPTARRRRPPSDHPRGAAADSASPGRTSRSPAWRTSRRGPGSGRRVASRPACSRSLHNFKRQNIHPRELAEMACHIEIDLLKDPVGKQDQYIAAFGGVTVFEFARDDTVTTRAVRASADTLDLLEDNLLMVSTGLHRVAAQVLKEQDDRSRARRRRDGRQPAPRQGARAAQPGGDRGREPRRPRPPDERALAAQEAPVASRCRTRDIDHWYDLAMANGALGGKLIGAGGGGFLLFYTEQKARLRAALRGDGPDRGQARLRL